MPALSDFLDMRFAARPERSAETGTLMFAVIKTGGKQYKVAASEVIEVEKLDGGAGDAISFGEVLMVGGESGLTLGTPLVEGATVAGEIVGQRRTAKILVFKKRRRQNSKRSRGHRQHLTVVRITEILTDGKAPSPKAEAAARPAARVKKPKAEPEATATEEAKPARKPRAKAAAKTKA